MHKGLRAAGYVDARAFLRGSAVRGIRGRDGTPFDSGGVKSDFDVAISSSSLMAKAKQFGVQLRSSGTRSEPLTPGHLRDLGLADLQESLSHSVGRDVTLMLYESEDAIESRDEPYMTIPE